MTKKNEEIISIDLDEEREKNKPKPEEKNDIEIKSKDTYIKIPNSNERIEEVIKVLRALQKEQTTGEPKQQTEQKQETEKTEEKPQEQEIKQEGETTILNKHEVFTKCPLCNGKIKKKKIQMASDGLRQVVVCKNRRCSWKHEYLIAL